MKTFRRTFTATALALAKPKTAKIGTPAKYLGRVSNNLSSGIVGLANVGKSTFFQAITKSTIGNPANYPFATIDPEEARIVVPSPKLDHLTSLYGSAKQVPVSLTIWDIAGLTRGASSGEGLGNKFLSDIRAVDGIYQVCRGFRDDEITHIEGSVDPVRDLTVVLDELLLKDLEFVEGAIERCKKRVKGGNKNSPDRKLAEEELATLEKTETWLSEGKRVASKKDWTPEEIDILNIHTFLTAKPTVYLLNVNEGDYAAQTNEFSGEVQTWIDENSPGDRLMLFSAAFETQYNELAETPALQQEYRDMYSGVDSVLPAIVASMREVLHLISFYTCGPMEARQWTIREAITTAPQAAGVIHTDLEKTFISATVTKWADLVKETAPLNEAKLKNAGKIVKAGKGYIVEDGDVMLVKAGSGKAR
ncbi:hypothetical protein BABINDRAFT_161340 [Babjeviella inositovora NRRL Y-12698]|uniref:Obg-like ATPase homolog n=1 Tax=Babjeviella inositovora NRRL Y-12698 TaxID=984486 RepID=A0A1E3QSC1_9ASCO|nr:uncharacterized protein BABINDRAFT_161340 [Babjeviella inositovora NRRL Y-12698]ODQ80394.1 hypothetical protein BABINDRAFT_161340 [Babjeviella inositovora NRRL Y-12698]